MWQPRSAGTVAAHLGVGQRFLPEQAAQGSMVAPDAWQLDAPVLAWPCQCMLCRPHTSSCHGTGANIEPCAARLEALVNSQMCLLSVPATCLHLTFVVFIVACTVVVKSLYSKPIFA